MTSKMTKLLTDNPDGLGMHVRSLRVLAHENVRFTWLMQGEWCVLSESLC